MRKLGFKISLAQPSRDHGVGSKYTKGAHLSLGEVDH